MSPTTKFMLEVKNNTKTPKINEPLGAFAPPKLRIRVGFLGSDEDVKFFRFFFGGLGLLSGQVGSASAS